EKSSFKYASFHVSGDTLVVSGEYPAGRTANYKLNRSPQDIKLYLPARSDIAVLNSNVQVKGHRIAADRQSWHFTLSGSNLFTRYNGGIDSLERYFDTL